MTDEIERIPATVAEPAAETGWMEAHPDHHAQLRHDALRIAVGHGLTGSAALDAARHYANFLILGL